MELGISKLDPGPADRLCISVVQGTLSLVPVRLTQRHFVLFFILSFLGELVMMDVPVAANVLGTVGAVCCFIHCSERRYES